MQPFRILSAVAAPIDRPNIDTDQITPERFLRRAREAGYGDVLFRDLRFRDDGAEIAEFVLNRAPFRHAGILVAAAGFGSGSSREQAAWGLLDYGIRCVIAPSFGDIFLFNAMKNGLLPVRLDADICAALRAQLHASPGAVITVDLPGQTVSGPEGGRYAFEIDPFRKRCLVEGLDEIDLTFQYEQSIKNFQENYRARFDWLFGREVSAC